MSTIKVEPPRQAVNIGANVTLFAYQTDPAIMIVRACWEQLSGPRVPYSCWQAERASVRDPLATVTIKAPAVEEPTELSFLFHAWGESSGRCQAEAAVTVLPKWWTATEIVTAKDGSSTVRPTEWTGEPFIQIVAHRPKGDAKWGEPVGVQLILVEDGTVRWRESK